jgi:branched-chain amino acid transport system ATP-binding protein
MTHLMLENLDVRHGQLRAVKDVNISIGKSEVLALVGANGAGKSTLLRAVAGAHKATSGRILVNGTDVTNLQSFERVKAGVSLVPEGRKLFQDMSVEENLMLGSIAGRKGDWTVAKVFEAFPNLVKRRNAKAGTLSGGEQQATAIGRALMSNPEILLLDEISLGLSPAAVDLVYASLDIIKTGTTIVLVEQDLSRAMSFATRIVCMLEGNFVLNRAAQNVTREEITAAYFGKRGGGH